MPTAFTAAVLNRYADSPPVRTLEIRDALQPGFVLRLQPSGEMRFVVQLGRGKRITLGDAHPRRGLKLADARSRAAELRAQWRNTQVAQRREREGMPVANHELEHPADRRRRERDEALRAHQAQLEHEAAAARRPHTLRQLLDIYEAHVGPLRKGSAAEIARMRVNFARFLDLPLQEVTATALTEWRAERMRTGRGIARKSKRKARPVSGNTVNRDLAPLRAAFVHGLEHDLVDVNPLARFKPAKVDSRGRVRFLSDAEEDRLRAALLAREQAQREARERHNQWRRERHRRPLPSLARVRYCDHIQPMVLLSLNTGVRRGELFALEWRDVDLVRAQLTVRGASAKSGTTRHVPLNDEALEVLTVWREQRRRRRKDLVFESPRGGRLDNVESAWRSVLKAADLTDFRWHDLRHSFASRLVMAGAGIEVVRELLGHATLTMTLRYAHLAPEHKRDAVALLVRQRAAEPAA